MKNILALFLVYTTTLFALNPPNTPTSLAGSYNGQISGGWSGNQYCTPQGTWIGPTMDGPANLPKNCMNTATSNTPAPGKVWGPINATSLLNTYNQVVCGDRILLMAGTSASTTTLPRKNCDDQHWIWIESTGVTDPLFPAEGVRVNNCVNGKGSMQGRLYSCASPKDLMVHFVAPSSSSGMVLPGADHIRFIGIDWTRVSTPGALIYALLDISSSTAQQTDHIVIDRSTFNGIDAASFPQTAATDTSTTRGLYLGQSNHIAVIDSAFYNIYDNGSVASNGNTDSQCIGGGVGSRQLTGWGVYKFSNNYCEGGSEGIVILGGDVGPQPTPAGCTLGVNCTPDVPTDIQVTNNYVFAPNFWNCNTTTINTTGCPNRKNGTEFKTGWRVLIEGNVFENCWYSSQPYCYVFDFAPKNQMYNATDPGHCPTCFVADGISRYNYSYNYPGPYIALYTTSYVNGCAGCGETYGNTRFSIHDNLVGDKMNKGQVSQTGFDCLETMATAGAITNVSMRHNTCVMSFRAAYILGAISTGQLDQWVIQDNVMSLGMYGALGATSTGCDKSAFRLYGILNQCINGVTNTWVADHNVHFNWDLVNSGACCGNGYPTNGSGAGNWFMTGSAGVGFVNYGTADSGFNPKNYALSSTSQFVGKASDGTNPGVDISTLLTKIAGVRQ